MLCFHFNSFIRFSSLFSQTYFKDWNGVKWNKTMIDELKGLYSYQGQDAITSYCIADQNQTPVSAYFLVLDYINNVCPFKMAGPGTRDESLIAIA